MRNAMRLAPIGILLLLVFASTTPSTPDVSRIREVDFKNFQLPWNRAMQRSPWTDQYRKGATANSSSMWRWSDSLPNSAVPVTDGIHRFYGPGDEKTSRVVPLLRVGSVVYGDLGGDGSEEAAVHINYSSGGTQNWGYLYVFKLVDGRPALVALLKAGDRAYGGLVKSDIRDGVLTVDFADQDRRIGDCCSEGYIRVHYRWKDGHFVEAGAHEKGDLHVEQR